MKKVKLLKDLPDFKAGTIFYLKGDKFYPKPVRYEEKDRVPFINAQTVIDNPDWFEDVYYKILDLDDSHDDWGTIIIGGELTGLVVTLSGKDVKEAIWLQMEKKDYAFDKDRYEEMKRKSQTNAIK